MANSETPHRLNVTFPGELDYIPLIRQLVSDTLRILHFSPKFSFRSEFLVDELCNNAVVSASASARSMVELTCEAYSDRVEFSVKGQGGYAENVKSFPEVAATTTIGKKSEISLIRMLADKVTCTIDENHVSHIHVVRKREG